MGTLQENQSLNAEYERNKKEREMKEEIERLKELCNKYEEEHKTVFEEWKKTINIINELEEDINKRIKRYNVDETINGIVVGTLQYVLDKLQELKGSDEISK